MEASDRSSSCINQNNHHSLTHKNSDEIATGYAQFCAQSLKPAF
jgi:hypothetical protein